jgi:hypothetical protein
MQQMGWVVNLKEVTNPAYMKAYDQVFIGEDVAEHYLNMTAKTNEEISAIVNSIKNQDLKDKVADALNQIRLMFPGAVITTINTFYDDKVCVIIYDFMTRVSVVDKITQ